jgi:AhpD family alkylhydroperoxidase
MTIKRVEQKTVYRAQPAIAQALRGLSDAAVASGLEKSLLELVKLRASQINGCAYCLNMHNREARELGESQERLDLVSVWHEVPCFTKREEAALAWTEALTLVADGHVPDAVYEVARAQFSEEELVNLTAAVVAINSWNRIAVAFRFMPPVKPA